MRDELCDLQDAERLAQVLRSEVESTSGSVLFYARFLFTNLTEAGQECVLAAIGAVARPGDLLAVEFRALGDAKLPKAGPPHFRRCQDGPAFAAALRGSHGFLPMHEEEGCGLAPYQSLLPPQDEEDPVVYRLVARRVERG